MTFHEAFSALPLPALDPVLARWVGIAIVWVATIVFVRYNERFFRSLDAKLERMSLNERTHHHLDRLADTFAVIVALLLTLGILGVGGALWGALTALGVAGIIIGFAAKDLVANIFAGFVILFEQPFVPGDAIEIAGQGGVVQSVSLRSTVLKTWDGRKVTLPNSTFITSSVINYSANPTRRVETTVAILHESDANRAREVLTEVADGYPTLIRDPAPNVIVKEVRDYALVLELWFWVPSTEYFSARTHAYVEITRRFREEGIELAIPLRRMFNMDAPAGGVGGGAASVGV